MRLAWTIVYAVISFLVSEIPLVSMRLVLPSGEPRSTIDASLSFAHFIHPSMPAFSRSFLFSSSVAFHSASPSAEPRYIATISSPYFSFYKIDAVLIL